MTTSRNNQKVLRCSFCHKSKDEVQKLIAGSNALICNECVILCGDILSDKAKPKLLQNHTTLLKPHEITAKLDEYIIGQATAKKFLAVAVYNHYKRIRTPDIEVGKSNILMIGPTGCGKTMLAQTLAKILDVPFAIADATSITETGYVGEDVESVILKLLQATNFDIEKTQQGIVYIDEVDKISRKSGGPSMARDISGEGVQQALLKLIEGSSVSVSPHGGRRQGNHETIQVDTTRILFICGGAFEGLDKIIEARTKTSGLGFGAKINIADKNQAANVMREVSTEDLVKYGLIPEFIGRLPVVATLEHLDEDSLVEIMFKPRNAIVKQYSRLLEIDGVELEVLDSAARAIAQNAMKRKSGARALRSVMEEILLEVMFEVPQHKDAIKVVVDPDSVDKKTKPKIIMASEKTNHAPVAKKKIKQEVAEKN